MDNETHNLPTEAMIRRVVRQELAAFAHLAAPTKLAYTIEEAADATGYSRSTIKLALVTGNLRAGYANSKPVIEADELRRWILSLPERPRR
jgi:hypothetical protein